MTNLYALKENARIDRGDKPFVVTIDEARELNKKDFGIFRTVNEFTGRRKIDCLKKILYWHIDIDKGSKEQQFQKIKEAPVWPSKIIESKNGFHVYFEAVDADYLYYKYILKGLNDYFCGDPKAAMVTVLLREPGFYHKKDPGSPFLVREISRTKARYRDMDMLYLFPYVSKNTPTRTDPSLSTVKGFNEKSLTDFLNSLDHELALTRMSGSSYVGGETYEFKPVGNGHKNIFVNGRTTSCFIDSKGMIGAIPGGPSLWQWLRYFNHSDKEIYRILKETFSEFK